VHKLRTLCCSQILDAGYPIDHRCLICAAPCCCMFVCSIFPSQLTALILPSHP
jgi:hypothetical protein